MKMKIKLRRRVVVAVVVLGWWVGWRGCGNEKQNNPFFGVWIRKGTPKFDFSLSLSI